jgi:hypothetical protein
MTIELLIRLTLIALGIFFLLLAAAGALLELAQRSRLEGVGSNPLDGITKLLEALKALFATLAAAPRWLGMGGFGVLLILLGAFLPLGFLN